MDVSTIYNNISKQLDYIMFNVHVLILRFIALLLAAAVLILPLRRLVTLYKHIASILLLLSAHFLSQIYVKEEQTSSIKNVLDDIKSLQRIGVHLMGQCCLAATVSYLIQLNSTTRISLLIYVLPIVGRIIGCETNELQRLHNCAFIAMIFLVVAFLFNNVPKVLDKVRLELAQAFLAVQVIGTVPFVLAMLMQLLIPVQFLTFWLLLFAIQTYKYVGGAWLVSKRWLVLLLASVADSCQTPISLVGLCITISYVSYLVITVSRMFLQGNRRPTADNTSSNGWTEGLTMFLLAVQTGMIELKQQERAFLMVIVLFIVLSSLIQSVYEMTDPLLLALGASQNKSVFKHARAVALCTILWLAPLYMTRAICKLFHLDFWLLVVVSSCVLTSVQVFGSLFVYVLFIYDAIRARPMTGLDDVVYYAKAATRTLEFLVAVFVVAYGIRETVFGDWSLVNTLILIIHCYCNVWLRLQSGWKSYLQRREAVKRVSSLPIATDEELEQFNDVCPICYNKLTSSACSTPCRHYFHAVCLRKWFYVQDSCPLCHSKIDIKK